MVYVRVWWGIGRLFGVWCKLGGDDGEKYVGVNESIVLCYGGSMYGVLCEFGKVRFVGVIVLDSDVWLWLVFENVYLVFYIYLWWVDFCDCFGRFVVILLGRFWWFGCGFLDDVGRLFWWNCWFL